MDGAALRAMQAPIKERMKSDPKSGLITLKAKGSTDSDGIACRVETGRALAVAGLHPATGGTGLELCSGDMLLEALIACAGVTLKAVSTALAIPPKAATVSAQGALGFRGGPAPAAGRRPSRRGASLFSAAPSGSQRRRRSASPSSPCASTSPPTRR